MKVKAFFAMISLFMIIACSKANMGDDISSSHLNGKVNGKSIEQWINTIDGLRMREKPNLDAITITVIPFAEKVQVLKTQGTWISIDEIKGQWSFVQWKTFKGWVFSGYLTGEDPNISPSLRHNTVVAPEPRERGWGDKGRGKPLSPPLPFNSFLKLKRYLGESFYYSISGASLRPSR